MSGALAGDLELTSRVVDGATLPEARSSALTGDLFEVRIAGSPKRIIVAAVTGTYAGGRDARFISALQDAAILLRPNAILLDFSALAYEWGDDIARVFPADDGTLGEEDLFCAIVVGERCRHALGTLLCDTDPDVRLDDLPWVYFSVTDAIRALAGG